MTTNFPASQDSFSRPTASSALTGHAALHDDLADAIEAVEAKVGSDSSAVTTSHDYKIAQLEGKSPTITLAGDASGSVTLTNLGNGTLTVAVNDDSHNHTIANVDNLQTTLDGKAASSHNHNSSYYTESEIDTKLTEATHNVTGLFKGIRGADSYAVNATGHATVNFGVTLASTPVAVFVQTTRQDTTGTGGGEYVLSLPVTAISSTSFTFRAYEVNVANSNNDSQVSTIYTSSTGSILVHASWLVIL